VAAPLPASNLANLLSLPARHFAAVDAGSQRTHIVVATVARGRPAIERVLVVDAHVEGLTTPEEMREEVRQRLREVAAEALVLVLPQSRILRHVLDVPPADAAQTRALVEREASHIGGLSESQWAFDSARLRPFGRLTNPLAAAFCRQDHLQEQLEAWAEDERDVFDLRPAGDALAAAFRQAAPSERNAVLVDLGSRDTALALLVEGQTVFSTSFPSGSEAFTLAIASDRQGPEAAAEVLKRTEPPAIDPAVSPRLHAAVVAWLADLDRTLKEWQEDHPDLAAAAGTWTAYLAGGGALQPGLREAFVRLGTRPFAAWPVSADAPGVTADAAVAWGALLLSLGFAGPAPTLLPSHLRTFWNQQRLWRALLSANLVLAAILALVLMVATWNQTRILAAKAEWKEDAVRALQQARDIRVVSEGFNARMDALRPVLESQRQTVETLQVLGALQQQRTNAQHWYVLLGDALSYAATSNNFPPPPPPKPPESRYLLSLPPQPATNAPPANRAYIAEVCLIPQGEQMRQALSELVGELKRYPLFRNVDILPSERRRDLIATNLVFTDRHFALELNLSESDLLPVLPLPRVGTTNGAPRATTFRLGTRPPEPAPATNPPPRGVRR